MANAPPAGDAAAIPLRLTATRWKLLADPDRLLPPGLAARLAGPPKPALNCTYAELDGLSRALADELDNGANAVPAKRLAALHEAVESLLLGYEHLAPPAKTRAAVRPDPRRVHQIKIVLLDARPEIWRRILVKDCTLDDLHGHIQQAMGWTNSHLHHFTDGRRRYGNPKMLDDPEVEDSRRVTLAALAPNPDRKKSLAYEYDFGDGWQHVVLVERGFAPEPGQKYPQCVDGARRGPPEDVGGVFGYEDQFLPALANPKHPEHRNCREWIGGAFDPEEFSAAAATKRLRGR